METVIPAEVLAHIRELAEKPQNPFEGGFTAQQIADDLELSIEHARGYIRQLLRDGSIFARRQGLSLKVANQLGYLSSCSIPVYYWRPE